MRKLNFLFLAVMLLLAKAGQGQGSNVTSTWNYMKYGELDKAKQAIDAASANESTMNDAKTWYYRGLVYDAIGRTNKPEYKSLVKDPFEQAVTYFQKCIQLDDKKKFTDDAMNGLLNATSSVYDDAVSAYNNKDYTTALSDFEQFISGFKMLKDNKFLDRLQPKDRAEFLKVDTASLYYAGIAANSMKNNEKAKLYFNKLINEYKYKEQSVYLTMSDMYKEEKDTAKALEVLEKGMAQAQDKKNILIDRLNIFIKQGKSAQAMAEGQKAIELDPNNTSVYIALGTMYQNNGKMKEAEDLYQKVLQKDPNNFYANNLLGVIYYNEGADLFNKSIELEEKKKMADSKKKADESKVVWNKAIQYLDKAYAADKNDPQTKSLLAEIYFKLGNTEKAQQIKAGK